MLKYSSVFLIISIMSAVEKKKYIELKYLCIRLDFKDSCGTFGVTCCMFIFVPSQLKGFNQIQLTLHKHLTLKLLKKSFSPVERVLILKS